MGPSNADNEIVFASPLDRDDVRMTPQLSFDCDRSVFFSRDHNQFAHRTSKQEPEASVSTSMLSEGGKVNSPRSLVVYFPPTSIETST
jgi:hypothetical protein